MQGRVEEAYPLQVMGIVRPHRFDVKDKCNNDCLSTSQLIRASDQSKRQIFEISSECAGLVSNVSFHKSWKRFFAAGCPENSTTRHTGTISSFAPRVRFDA